MPKLFNGILDLGCYNDELLSINVFFQRKEKGYGLVYTDWLSFGSLGTHNLRLLQNNFKEDMFYLIDSALLNEKDMHQALQSM